MNKYDQILALSKRIDTSWQKKRSLAPAEISFPVPKGHRRYSKVQSYKLIVKKLAANDFKRSFLIVDKRIADLVKYKTSNVLYLDADEASVKEMKFVRSRVKSVSKITEPKITVIGGGVVINTGAYIAEKLQKDLVNVPTSIIAMCDGAIGGKVRVNSVQNNKYKKHSYKSFYEPNKIILDPSFLYTLSRKQIRIGLAEIVKHALYQSEGLCSYLLSSQFNPFEDRKSLLKAILWTADLKRICLEVDPDESKNCSYKILRAAHDISDKIEEKSRFELSHGQAVLMAMRVDLAKSKKLEMLVSLYKKLRLDTVLK